VTDAALNLDLEDLRLHVAEALGEPAAVIGDHDDLLRLGLDSISMMRLAARWRLAGADVTFGELVEGRTLSDWWALVSARRAQAASAGLGLPTVDDTAPFPLAPMQHAYWIGRADGQPLGGVGAHFYAELNGTGLQAARLEAAVRRVIGRHGMLRVVIDDEARQRIRATAGWPGLTVHDLSTAPAQQAKARLLEIRRTLSHRRLAVGRGEVFDIQLSLLPGGATRVHLQIEMLVADAQSFRVLLSDLARAYEGDGAALRPLGISYPQYRTAIAARTAGGPDGNRDRAYWQDRLATLPGPPELPLARSPEQVAGHQVIRHHRWLDSADVERISARAREHGVTPSVAFLTAFAEVLAAWSAVPRFLLNLPFYAREQVHPDVAELVGDFTGLVLLEVDASRPASFAERARALQRQLHADAAHGGYGGDEVLRDLARQRGTAAAGAPVVFTSALNLGELFDPAARRTLGTPGWTVSQTPQVWLDHQITEREDGVLVNWDAVDGLFVPGVVEEMFAAYGRLLDRLLAPGSGADRERPMPVLPAERTQRTRAAANATAASRRKRCLHDDVFARAAADPDRTAVVWETAGVSRELGYGELAARADRLAAALAGRGLAPGEPVAVSLPKGPDQVAAVLGVLRAGGVYVPVGPEQPAARRARIHAAAGARLVVADPAGPVRPPEGCEPVPLPGPDAPLIAAPVPRAPSDLAYLLFTSGSTGEPKGVEVPHEAAMNTLDDLIRRFGIGPGDRVLAVSALDFDLSVFDIFGLLGAGAGMVLVADADRRDAAAQARLVRRHRVTIWQSVPALLDMLLLAAAAEPVAGPLPLRLALAGGDWVGLDLAGRLAAFAPGASLVALGGTTETAIHSTVQPVPHPVPAGWMSVPYGFPLENQRLRVADEHGRDRPDWVPGELWIGGGSVARGYRGDPERTAQRFIERDGVRWYRTGDLARYWPDGTVEFLGRADFQVKIRGHRTELGEIETALERHPLVTRAVAVAVGHGARRQLAAAVRPDPAAEPVSPAELLGWLADQVPAYMVPARARVLTELPLSANGKIDRAAVRTLLEHAEPAAAEPPRGEMETLVASAWARQLGAASVGRTHSFFALGGDSLVATRLVGELRAAGLEGATLRRLFAEPVLADFAAGLRRRASAGGGLPTLTADPAARFEPFDPTDVQRAYWLGRSSDFELGGVGSHWYWEFDGASVDVGRLEEAVNRLVERHDMLRAVFRADGRQQVLPTVPRFRIQRAAGKAALAALRGDLSRRVPDPARWPLLEIHAVACEAAGEERTRLGFSFDYIVLDALSIVTFLAELSALYRDPDTVLPPVGVTFRDYVVGAQPAAEEVARAQEYWSARAEVLPSAPPLPLATDPASLAAPVFGRRAGRLEPAEWRSLQERARAHDLTAAVVLAAAYAEVLAAWSGLDALTLNLTMFNRRPVHPDIGRVLGDFTSLLLVAHQPQPGEEFVLTARRLQEQVWEGIEHSEVSALWVLRELGRRSQSGPVAMPVVFTSALGVAADLVELAFPFGELHWGISQTPQVWLDNQVMERAGGLAFSWDFVEELFPAGMVDAMFGAYEGLLRRLAASDWDGPLPDLLPAGQHRVRAQANATDGPLAERGLHERFFARAQAEPDRPALMWGADGLLSYGELADRALRIAGVLRARGLAPAEPVAVTIPRGADQVAAVLGVLAAGGSYVPVGVDQPPARRSRIYGKAGVRLVIADQRTEVPGVEVVPPRPAAEPLAEPVPVQPGALAYTIFTSGSTGEPKGVEIAHRAAVNTVDDISERYAIGPDDRVLAVSSLDFDLSVYDIFGLLSAGGGVVLVDEADRREARQWAALARRWQVSVWNSVPALLDMLLLTASPEDVAGLKVVLVSGDWVGLDLPGRLSAAADRARFVALGGATEAAIWSNALEVAEVPAHWRSVPYGFPLRNQRYRVVDGRGRDCPDWVPGELWIGGAGVALGYRNDPEITARQFVAAGRERWYRTGDLGRYWPNGTLEFLGRRDFQVKVRGHRIELGEVEAAAESHAAVGRAVAFTVDQGRARQLALALIPASGDAPPAVADVLDLLTARMPAYMVPERVVVVSDLPLSPNGKVDRRRLGELAASAATDPDDAPPAGGTEKLIAGLWSGLLERDDIGRGQSFFALGGDSLLATRMIEQLRQHLGVVITLRQLFMAPTIAELAEASGAGAPGAEADVEEGQL